MTFRKKPPKPPKATLDDLMQSGSIRTGKQVVDDALAKAKQAAEFDRSVHDELLNRRGNSKG